MPPFSSFNSNPLNLSQGSGKLQKPTGNIPGSGIVNWIGNLFSAPTKTTAPAQTAPLVSPAFTNLQNPFANTMFGGNAGGMSLPILPQRPSLTSQVQANQQNGGASGSFGATTAYASTAAPGGTAVGATNAGGYPTNPDGSLNYLAFSPAQIASHHQDIQNTRAKATQLSSSPSGDAGYTVGSSNPQNFGVQNSGNTYDSSYLSQGSLQDLMDMRAAKERAMMSGKNLDGSDATGFIPSDTLQGQIANQLYQSKLYSPDEQALIQNGQDLSAQINQKKLAERRKTAQLLQDGTITREQATQFVQESERRANQELADLSVQQDSTTARLTALGLLRQNQVGALQSIQDTLKGSEVSPGSTLYNPITGVQYQGTGAAPAQIASYAQQLEQSSIQQGTARYTTDGSIDHNYYYGLANSQLSPNGGMGGGMTSPYGGSTSAGQMGQGVSPSDPAFYQSLPNTVAPAFRTLSNGQAYFDSSKLDSSGLGTARAISKQSGVPILDGNQASAVEDLQSVENGLNTTQTYFQQLAPEGMLGKLTGTITNPLSKLFSTDYGSLLKTYQSNKDNLFRQVSAFAGSHPRINTTELVTQAQALPTIGNTPFGIDSLKDGLSKMTLLHQTLDNIRSSIIPNSTGQYNIPSVNIGGTVQTKAGAINTNW